MPKAKNLKYCRTKANLTQQAFADAIGASKSTVTAWETKKRAIPVPSAKKIAEFFGIDYTDFCDVDMESLDLSITDKEKREIKMFRRLPENTQTAILAAVYSAYDNMLKQEAEDGTAKT